jgi:Xaa-Pro aminopeptidase
MGRTDVADERLCNPISTAELQRRWAAVRAAMPEQKLDALIVQGCNNLAGTGGYFRWFTGVSMWTSYPATIIFPKDGLMTLVSHGPIGGERELNGNDAVWRGVGKALSTASFPAIDYCIPYDPELVAREIKKAGYRNVGIVGWNNMLFGFGDKLRSLLDGVTLSDATRLIDPIKAIKSAEEIQLIRLAAEMQDEILAQVQPQIAAGRKDYQLFAYGHYVGNLLGSETGYMLGSSSAPGTPTNIRPRREQGRELRDGDVLYYQCENTGPGGMMTHVGRYYVLGKAPQELVDAFGIICEAQDNTVRMLQPGASPKEIFAEHNAFMEKHGMHKEPRLHCHGQGYDVVERPMIRHDEDMPLAKSMNIGLHPTFGNARLFVTVCDNFLIAPDGKIEALHKTARKIFEL